MEARSSAKRLRCHRSPDTKSPIRPCTVRVLNDRRGGHKNTFVGGPNSPIAGYICPLCKLVAKHPHQARCCGVLFCNVCLSRRPIKARCRCPHCARVWDGASLFPDTRAEREISQLRVLCEHSHAGCPWNGKLADVTNHEGSCQYNKRKCPNGCKALLETSDLESHLELDCPKRPWKCDYCGVKGKHDELSGTHPLACPMMLVPCPNVGCKRLVPRMDVDDHRLRCPKEEVACSYAGVGCRLVCPREDMFHHRMQEMVTHLDLTNTVVQNMGRVRNTVVMANFTGWKESNVNWHSPGFYNGPGGYMIGLSVFANGQGEGANTHISVYIFLYEGEHDGSLEWPLQGEFSIELLNLLEDDHHHEQTIMFDKKESTHYNSRVIRDKLKWDREELGTDIFIPHAQLGYDPGRKTQYLTREDDKLYFRVTTNKLVSKTKSWLTTDIVEDDLL